MCIRDSPSGPGVGPGRSGGECAAPEFDYVSGIAGDLLHPADRWSDQRGGDLLFHPARDYPLVAATPWPACSRSSASGRLNAARVIGGFSAPNARATSLV